MLISFVILLRVCHFSFVIFETSLFFATLSVIFRLCVLVASKTRKNQFRLPGFVPDPSELTDRLCLFASK